LQQSFSLNFKNIDVRLNKIENKIDVLSRKVNKKEQLARFNFENVINSESPLSISANEENSSNFPNNYIISHQPIQRTEEFELLGIHKNISLKSLLSSGWQIIYDKGYDHYSNNLELNKIKNDFMINNNLYLNTLICVGALNASVDCDKMLLCGIDFISNALEESNSLTEAREGSEGIYWYWVTYKSFGFGPNSRILLSCADSIDIGACDDRISWCVHGTCGGSRLGVVSALTKSNYKKVILVKIYN